MKDIDQYIRARRPEHVRFAYLLVADAQQAEDIVHSVYLGLVKRAPSHEPPRDLDAYVRAAIVKSSAGWKRRLVRQKQLASRQTIRESTLDPDIAERVTFMQLIGELPPRQRAVIVLQYYEDRSTAETAQILGCNEGTVKSQASKARAHLRQRWEQMQSDMQKPQQTGRAQQ